MSTLIIKRSDNSNKLKNYQIFLDEEKIGSISNDQTKIFEVKEGHHTLVVKIGWWSSSKLSLTLHDDECKTFIVRGSKNGESILIIAAGLFGFNLISGFLFNNYFGVMLTIPALLLIIYYLTLGQKTYFTLSEFKQANAQQRVWQ
jgi:hypothetical protein